MRNGFVESFNGRMRGEFLNEPLFRNLAHARELTAAWVTDYNTTRPHSALGCQSPAGFARNLTAATAVLLHAMKVPRAGRLLTPRQRAQMTIGLRSRLDERPVAGQSISLRRNRIAAPAITGLRHHGLEYLALVIDGAPEVLRAAVDPHKDRIQMPPPLLT